MVVVDGHAPQPVSIGLPPSTSLLISCWCWAPLEFVSFLIVCGFTFTGAGGGAFSAAVSLAASLASAASAFAFDPVEELVPGVAPGVVVVGLALAAAGGVGRALIWATCLPGRL